MGLSTDRLTETSRERELMRRVRSGELAPEELRRQVPAFPLKIQIQTASPCNASCVMCPWPETKTRLPQGFMDEELFRALARELEGRGIERTSLFLMNEPLLDRRLEAFTRIVVDHLPETTTVIYTNGVLLSGERARALAGAGMDEVNVSVTGFDAESYARTMRGIDFDVVMSNLADVGRLARAGALGATRVRVVGLEFPGALDGAAEFTRRTGIEVFLKPVTNRAGSVDPDALGAETERAPTFRACQRPFVKAYVLYNGDVCLCNCDWERSVILGNLRERPLADIWDSGELWAIRLEHLRRELRDGSLCAHCDYPYLT